uniref:BHLH domain-containing protein n=1 Tax=Ciona savignyi TaxID=51511 RepID=H2YXA0_CIOSA
MDHDVSNTSSSITSSELARRRLRLCRLREQSFRDTAPLYTDGPNIMPLRTSQSPPLRHNGFQGVSKRGEANARERLRVRNLNSGFAKLRRILPTVPPNRKPSKVDTLQGAIDYIHQLEHLLEATGGIPEIGACSAGTLHPHSRQSVTESPFFPVADLNPPTSQRFERKRSKIDRHNFQNALYPSKNHQFDNPLIKNRPKHNSNPIKNKEPVGSIRRRYIDYVQATDTSINSSQEFHQREFTSDRNGYFPKPLPSWEFSPVFDSSQLCGSIEQNNQQNPIPI